MLRQLAAVCRDNALGEKIVISPSLAIGHQIGDALAHSGTPWVNLRFESVRTLVDAVVGFDLAMEGVRVLSRAQALALVESACDRAVGDKSYFAELADRPGLHRAVQRSIDDLRLAGVELLSSRAGFEDEQKADDLAAIVAAYEEELEHGNYVDRAAVLLRAIRKLEEGANPWPTDTTWVLLEDVELSSEEQRFLELASRGKLKRIENDGESSLTEHRVEFTRAVGEENEIRAAFRTLLAGAHPFDSAEIVYSRRDAYLPLAYELSSELAVPATFAEGIAASFTRPGRACVAFLEWIGNGWEARTLQRAAGAGSLQLPDITIDGESSRLSPTAFSRILRDARIGWGRDRYLDRIDAWTEIHTAGDEAGEAGDDEAAIARRARSAATGRATRELCEQLLEFSEPVASGEEIDMPSLAAAASRFVDALAASRSEIDGMAKRGIQRMLDELAELPAATAPRSDATGRLADAVRNLHVAASNPRPGHLHFAPLHAGGWSGRPRTFIVGLDDAKYPGAGLQDPILLDSERAALNQRLGEPRLQMRGEAPERMAKQFERLLQRLARRSWPGNPSPAPGDTEPDRENPEHTSDQRLENGGSPSSAHRLRTESAGHGPTIHISYPSFDIIERRALYPSSAVLETFRRSRRKDDATYDDAIRAAAPAGFIDSPPLTLSEWWQARRNEGAISDSDVYRHYPWLGSGAEALAARASDRLTRWDGFIDAPREEIDPRHTGKVYSASQLERMAKCPIGYFFERHLRIEPIEELERDPDVWLSAMENGSLFHEIAERFMREVCAAGDAPTYDHGQRLREIADEELQKLRRQVPPPNETAFDRRREELFDTLEVFLRGEVDCGTVRAKFFEAPFGFPSDDPDTLSMPDPLILDLGGGRSIRLRGKIDRVDFDEASKLWDVWDYKTGSTYEYREGERLARGTKVQHAIYAKAICAMLERQGLPSKVGRSGYYFPTRKGRALRQARGCDEGELERTLNLLFDVVGNGFFPHPMKEGCRFCEYEAVRGDFDVAEEQMQRKFEANAEHPAVKAWLALQEVR